MNHDGDLFGERRKKERRRVDRRKNVDPSSRDRRKNDRRIININETKKDKK